MEDLTDKVVVVTGAAGGIGYAMAEAFAGVGAKVVLADLVEDELATAVERLTDAGATALGVPTDVSQADQVDALRDATLAAHGAVHVLCNNAGVGGGGVSWTIPLEQWKWVLGVDLFGVIHGVHTFTPLFLEQREGAPGVGVSVLCPGWVNTRIYDVARYRPEGAEPPAPPEEDSPAGGFGDIVKNLVTGGLDPSEVGAQVVESVQQRRFYILTHPEWMPLATDRTARMVDGRGPVSGILPTSD